MGAPADRHARIVIVGGGAVGASVACHLAWAGERDVLLLEKARLTHGCTWHAAGLVGQLRSKRNLTRMMQDSVAVFDRLEKETDSGIGWKKVGSLRLASTPGHWSEIRRSMSHATSFGVECEGVSAAEVKRMFPFISTEGVEGAAFIAGDGHIDPYLLTQAYAKAARAGGVRIKEGVTVTDIAVEGRRAVAVVTDHGTVGCEVLVNCAGLWAKRVGEMAGVPLAAAVVEHQYFLTEKKLDPDPGLTTLRDPGKNFYLKPEPGAFAIGGWEDGTKGCWRNKPPLEFGRELFPADMERLERFAIPAAERLPVLGEVGIQRVINGPIPLTPDGEPMMGLAPRLDNFYVACGFIAGIAASGGAGRAMANWILHGDPGMDLWAFDVRRFGEIHAQDRHLEECAIEAYASHYKVHWPGEERGAGRGLRRSPLHRRLEDAGAVFGSKFGWERPNWFAPPGTEAADRPSFEGRPNWFVAVAKECEAIRGRAAVIDQTSFSKLEVTGPNAHRALDRIAANKVPEQPGRAVYTQLCNGRGGIEADVTIVHVAKGRLMVVTGAGFAVRDRHWIETHLPPIGVEVRDVSGSLATINVCGPRARDILAAVTDGDVGNEAFPFLGARELQLGSARGLAVRIGYVGELGWELYVAQEFAEHVHEALWEAGLPHGIAHAGYRAIESCRLEKGYLYWSSDIGPDVNPYEAGLGFCVALDKGDFIGREALARIREQGPARRMATLALEGFAPLHGGEPILQGDKVVGTVSSAGHGHTVGHTIAYGLLPAEVAEGTKLGIEAFGKVHAATKAARCLHDPGMQRLKA